MATVRQSNACARFEIARFASTTGSTAVINSYLGHRVGFWNPAVYAFATRGKSPFTVLGAVGTRSDNLYFTGNPGSVYNEGSGLGFPDLSELALDFAGEH